MNKTLTLLCLALVPEPSAGALGAAAALPLLAARRLVRRRGPNPTPPARAEPDATGRVTADAGTAAGRTTTARRSPAGEFVESSGSGSETATGAAARATPPRPDGPSATPRGRRGQGMVRATRNPEAGKLWSG